MGWAGVVRVVLERCERGVRGGWVGWVGLVWDGYERCGRV